LRVPLVLGRRGDQARALAGDERGRPRRRAPAGPPLLEPFFERAATSANEPDKKSEGSPTFVVPPSGSLLSTTHATLTGSSPTPRPSHPPCARSRGAEGRRAQASPLQFAEVEVRDGRRTLRALRHAHHRSFHGRRARRQD